MEIKVMNKVLAANDAWAQENRALLKKSGVLMLNLIGSPGAGKTALLEATLDKLKGKLKVGVIEGDIATTKDAERISKKGVPVCQINTGTACHLDANLVNGAIQEISGTTKFDVIFVETVGVGQSELAVHSMVDFFLLLMLAGAGDELQGIKRGIMEMADAIIINKADGDNINKAKTARVEYKNALHLFPPAESGWDPVVDICSARTRLGIETVWNFISDFAETTKSNGFFDLQRKQQFRQVLTETIDQALKSDFYSRKDIVLALTHYENEVMAGNLSPYTAAAMLLETTR